MQGSPLPSTSLEGRVVSLRAVCQSSAGLPLSAEQKPDIPSHVGKGRGRGLGLRDATHAGYAAGGYQSLDCDRHLPAPRCSPPPPLAHCASLDHCVSDSLWYKEAPIGVEGTGSASTEGQSDQGSLQPPPTHPPQPSSPPAYLEQGETTFILWYR